MTADQKYSLLDDCFPGGKKEGGTKFLDDVRKMTEKETAAAKNEKSTGEAEKAKPEPKSKIQEIELNVDICCDKCVKNVTDALDNVQGVERVDCDQVNRKVYVKGSATKEVVLKKVRMVKRRAEVVEKK